MENKICVGIVRKPQGIKGEVKVSVLLDNNELIKKIDTLFLENGEELKVKRVFNLGNEYGIGFLNFSTPEQALAIKNKKLFADKQVIRNLIGNDNFFLEDLIGKIAVCEDGTEIGKIVDIENYGASDVVFVESKKYHNLCFANTGDVFVSIDDEKNQVLINKEKFLQTKVCDEDDE